MSNKRDSRFEDITYDGQVEDEDHNAWAVSYGDVVSVLLTFLFLILSISDINPKKYEQIQKQVKNEEDAINVDKIFASLQQIVQEEGISEYVDISKTSTGVDVNIGEKLLFQSGKAIIQRKNIQSLKSILKIFNELPKEYNFGIEGHTDDIPINNREYPSNWYLSADRALSVLELFLAEGFDKDRFSVQGKADTKPLVDVFDEKGNVIPGSREKNRRVLIKVQ